MKAAWYVRKQYNKAAEHAMGEAARAAELASNNNLSEALMLVGAVLNFLIDELARAWEYIEALEERMEVEAGGC